MNEEVKNCIFLSRELDRGIASNIIVNEGVRRMSLFTCKECGVPKLIPYILEWHDRGTIETRSIGGGEGFRSIILERELVNGLLRGIEEKLGISIDHILYEGKRKDSKYYAESLLQGLKGKIMRLKPLRRVTYIFMIVQSAIIGLGRVQALKYKPGDILVGRVKNIYNLTLFSADATGGFEVIEGMRARAFYGSIGDREFIIVAPWSEAPEEERLTPVQPKSVEAHAGYHRCGSCGIPREISRFRWDTKNGKIIDTDTREWVFVIGSGYLNALISELEYELGEEIPRLLQEYVYNFYHRLAQERECASLRGLGFIKARGLGVPEVDNPSMENLSQGFYIRNGVNGPLLAGITAAVCDIDFNKVTWDEQEEGIIKIKLAS